MFILAIIINIIIINIIIVFIITVTHHHLFRKYETKYNRTTKSMAKTERYYNTDKFWTQH